MLWETATLGTYMEVYTDALALAGTTVLRADRGASLHAYGATDGKVRWSQRFGEVVKRFCSTVSLEAGSRSVAALVQTADDKWCTPLGHPDVAE